MECSDSAQNQEFIIFKIPKPKVQPLQQGIYAISSKFSGMCMDVQSYSKDNDANVQQINCHDGPSQHWILSYDKNYAFLKATHSNKALTVYAKSKSKGTSLVQWEYQKKKHQLWKIKKIEGSSDFQIINAFSGMCADVSGESKKVFAKIIQVKLLLK